MEQAHIFISGFVQGIGFRQFVKKQALRRDLTGYVKNLPDGRVEAVLQGRRENIEKMVLLCSKGPFLSEVENIDVVWEDNKDQFKDFKIL